MKIFIAVIALLISALILFLIKPQLFKENPLIGVATNLHHERSEYTNNYKIFLDSIHAKVVEDLAFDGGKRDAVIIRYITFIPNISMDFKITNFGEEIINNQDKSELSMYVYKYVEKELSDDYFKKNINIYPESDVRIFKDSIASGPVFTILGSNKSKTFTILSLEIQP